jgi:ATP adenylyltransferase
MRYLHAPWRAGYIGRAARRSQRGCLFCRLARARSDARHRILYRGSTCFVVLNAFPYTSGHLMIAPYAHRARLGELAGETGTEIMVLATKAEHALERAYRPDGLNVGFNLGAAAGAGVAGHLHLHVLPRWLGDTNFMSVIGEVRVVPEALDRSYRRLLPYFRPRSTRRSRG